MDAKTQMFARELLVAAGKSEPGYLREAAQSFAFVGYQVLSNHERVNCRLCHASLVHIAHYRDDKNGMAIQIGPDCALKLERLKDTGELRAITQTEGTYRSRLKTRLREAIGSDEDVLALHAGGKRKILAAMTTWLSAQEDLPEHLREAVRFVEQFGYAPSTDLARAIVEYYKARRRFPTREMLTCRESTDLTAHPHWKLFPEGITLARLPKLLALIDRGEGHYWEVLMPQRMRRAVRIEIARLFDDGNGVIRVKFKREKHPKTQQEQWAGRAYGNKYILSYDESYSLEEGTVPVVCVHTLGPHLRLVRRIKIVEQIMEHTWGKSCAIDLQVDSRRGAIHLSHISAATITNAR